MHLASLIGRLFAFMDITKTKLRTKIQQMIVVSRGLKKLPRTRIDIISTDKLRDIESSDELLELAWRWIVDVPLLELVDTSEDTILSWPSICEWMPYLEKALLAME